MVRFLLEAGADQEHKTDEMHTALMEACMVRDAWIYWWGISVVFLLPEDEQSDSFWPLLGTEPNFVFWLSGHIDPLSDDEGGE